MIKTKLSNGLTVVTNTNKSVQTVMIAVGVHTGNKNETKNEIGLSHALEHMLFKGTKTRSYEVLNNTVEDVGSYTNAFTSNEQTVYYIKGLKNHLEMSIDILSDQVLNSVFPDEEIKKEMGVIVQEIKRSGDNPSEVVYKNFMQVAFKGSTLENPILGSQEQVMSYTPDDMRNYYKKHYQPKNMILSVSGNVDHKNVVKLAKKYFKTSSKFKKEKVQAAKWNSGECLVHTEGQQQVNVIIGWKIFGRKASKKDCAALALANCILGNGMSSMLMKEVREKRGLCYGVGSFTELFDEIGYLGINGGTDNEKLDNFLDAIALVVRDFNKNVTDDALVRAKNIIKTHVSTEEENITGVALQNISSLQHYKKITPTKEKLKVIDSITLSDIKKIMTKIMKDNVVLSIYGYAPQLTDKKLSNEQRISLSNFQKML